MKRVVVIPARYGSTRLPGKPLREIGGKPLIRWVYEAALTSRFADRVIIATDDERIWVAAASFGAEAVMTSPSCRSGTDRVFEALKDTGADMVVNLQGDEPEIRGDMIDRLFRAIEEEHLDMATLCSPISEQAEYADENVVKVVLDRTGFALYFSRSPIPCQRGSRRSPLYKHIGIYGFSMSFLVRFVSLEKGVLEETESLEQLRVLENGYRIKVLPVAYDGIGIDTEEDAERFFLKLKNPAERNVP
jgi:3-deoxy-manno-octulosonate cytidylyltransferase (CMP-KDO synthetase)